MNFRHTLFALVLLISNGLLAQKASIKKDDNVKLNWGADFKLPKKHFDIGFIGSKEEGLAEVAIRPKKAMVFQKFDSKFKAKGTETVDLKKYPKGFTNEGLKKMGNNQYWFYSAWDKKNKKEQLYCDQIDLKSAKLKGKEKKIVESKKLSGVMTATGFYSFAIVGKYNFYFNYDTTMLMVQYRTKPEERNDKKNKDVIGINIFDKDMNKLWGKEVKMPYTEAEIDNIDYQLDKAGNAYILIKMKKGKEKVDKKKQEVFDLKVLKITKDSKEVKVIDLDFKSKFVGSLRMYENKKGNIQLIGFYSNERSGVDGVMSAEMKGEVFEDFKFNEIPDNVIKQFENLKTQKKMDKKENKKGKDGDQEASNLNLSYVRFNDDGTMTVTAEEFYYTVTVTRSGNSTRTTYHYYYNDIYVMFLDPDGEMIWAKKIPKSQAGSTSYYHSYESSNTMSFYYQYYQGDHYIIFMDNAKNANLKNDQRPATHSDGWGGMVSSVRLDKDGNMFRQKLFDVRDQKKSLRPREFDKIAPNMAINRAYGKGVSNPVVLTFDEED